MRVSARTPAAYIPAMKKIPIFRAGRHTASNGASLEFSETQLREAVAAYSPAVHEAPIVIGHPKDNGPAYGWVDALSFDEDTGEIVAHPTQVDAAFDEMVLAGRFKKRSASWYLPDAPTNPTPGKLYLRHVGFLGAQPPAVKGLKEVAFSDADEGVVEFGDSARYAWGSVNAMLRGLREWIIGKDGLDTADKILPNFYLSDLEAAAKQAADTPATPATMPVAAFTEDDPVTLAELQAQVAQLTAELAAAKANARPADFAERESNLAAREAAIAAAEAATARAATEARVDAAIKAGRLLPKDRKQTVDFAMSLADKDASIDFGEGATAAKVTQREAYLRQREAGPKLVEFGELSGADGTGTADVPSLADLQAAMLDQVASGKPTK